MGTRSAVVKGLKIKNALNTEGHQLEFFRTGFEHARRMLIPNDERTARIIETVVDTEGWADCSGKDMPPPDFVCESKGIMLEAMLVDDHERPGDKKGFVNPVRAREGEIIKEYESEFSELLASAAEGATLTVTGKTDLPTAEDHNYEFYLSSFKRIVDKHAAHANVYRSNHPGLELAFFVFDESTFYLEASERYVTAPRKGEAVRGHPHYWFAGAAFLSVIERSEADYFIWYTPFKQPQLFAEELALPDTVVYDLRRFDPERIIYDRGRVISSEE